MDKYISNKIKKCVVIHDVFVVLLHSNNLESAKDVISANSIIQNFIGQGIVRIAVPVFFLISGYLFFYNFTPTMEKWKYKFKKQIP